MRLFSTLNRTARRRLRAAIAAIYPGATADHVQVTNGGAEANFITAWNLIEPGDEVVMMVPNFMQAWGLARAFGAVVKPWPLVNGRGQGRAEAAGGGGGRSSTWRLDRLVSPRTRLIAICNPNNPTGARFDAGDLDRIAAIADRYGSWILSDEIYRGAERDGRGDADHLGPVRSRASSPADCRRRTGCPACASAGSSARRRIVSMWSYHDYTTIAPGALNDALARHALEPARRERLLARTRGILNRNYPIIAGWLDASMPVQLCAARRWRDRLRAYAHAHQLHRARHQAARREEPADRAGRPFRHGRLPALRLRR